MNKSTTRPNIANKAIIITRVFFVFDTLLFRVTVETSDMFFIITIPIK